MSGLLSAIRDELSNKEFRDSYVAENVRRGLAYQIRALRESREWTQAEFSRQAGKPQSNIFRWEDPTYGKFTVSTLLEIAATFDVALVVKFVGFQELLASTSDLSRKKLAAPSYGEEQQRVMSATIENHVGDAARAQADAWKTYFQTPSPPIYPQSPSTPSLSSDFLGGQTFAGRPA